MAWLLVTYYVLFFLHLESRRVTVAGITQHPEQHWMEQVGRSATHEGWAYLHPCRYVLHGAGSGWSENDWAAGQEPAVLLAERWVIAVLRQRRFSGLAELNEAIGQLLEKLNQGPFRKREGSRASLFAGLDRPALQPLPAERYVLAYWKTVRASIFCGLRRYVAQTLNRAFWVAWNRLCAT